MSLSDDTMERNPSAGKGLGENHILLMNSL